VAYWKLNQWGLGCLPAHTHHCGRQTLPTPFTLHTTPARAQTRIVHTQHPIHKSEESANQNCVPATPNSQFPNNTHTEEHTRGGGSKRRVQERLGEWVLSRNCGCERGSRQVSTISDAGTRYALHLS